MSEIQKHFRTCNLCEAMCGIVIEHKGSEIVSIRGDEEDSFSRGHICPKAVALSDIHNDPDRLKTPLRRTPGGWEEVSWEAAFDEVASRLKEIQTKYGRHSVAVYQGNPTVHNYGSVIFGQLFIRALHTKNNFSATSVDQLPHMFAAYQMFGHQLLMPIPDIDRTDFFLIIGANPMISNGSLMTAPDIKNRLKAIKARGGTIIVVDPRRTETAQLADQHLFIRPGTDALFLASMLHVLFAEGLVRLGRLASFTEGVEDLQRAVQPFSPERTSPITRIPPDKVRSLARDFAKAKTAVCYGRVGASMQEFGGLCAWLINSLNIVSGNFDQAGGAMITSPAIDVVDIAARIRMQGRYARYRSRVRGLPEFSGELPSAALAEDILQPGPGQIRALVTSAGNPVLSTPNGRKLDEALKELEFMVSVDIYLNETTRHAHLILPPTFSLEHDNYDAGFHLLAVRNTAKYSPALFEKAPSARHDWEIFLELASRMGPLEGPLGDLAIKAKKFFGRRLSPTTIVDLGLRLGPYGDKFNPFNKQGLSLQKLKDNPHGIDLGPLQSVFPEKLHTKEKKIQLTPEVLRRDFDRLEETLLNNPAAPGLLLIGRRELRTNNSWSHNSYRMVKGKERCTLLMHPEDAQKLSLQDGQRVSVSSRVGRVEVPLQISEEVMPGVVSLPHGWGHNREGIRLQVASQHAGESINDLTDEARVDLLSGVAALSGTPVVVRSLSTSVSAEA